MAKRCTKIKEDGNRCEAFSLTDSDLCFSHDPEYNKEREIAVINGGKQIKRTKVDSRKIYINNSVDVCQLIVRCINELRQNKLNPKQANAIGYLSNIVLNGLKQVDGGTLEETEAPQEDNLTRKELVRHYYNDVIVMAKMLEQQRADGEESSVEDIMKKIGFDV